MSYQRKSSRQHRQDVFCPSWGFSNTDTWIHTLTLCQVGLMSCHKFNHVCCLDIDAWSRNTQKRRLNSRWSWCLTSILYLNYKYPVLCGNFVICTTWIDKNTKSQEKWIYFTRDSYPLQPFYGSLSLYLELCALLHALNGIRYKPHDYGNVANFRKYLLCRHSYCSRNTWQRGPTSLWPCHLPCLLQSRNSLLQFG